MTKSRVTACEPVPLMGQSSARCPAVRRVSSNRSLSSNVMVLTSTTTRRGAPEPAIAIAVACRAAGLGRLVMSVPTARATAAVSSAISTAVTGEGGCDGLVRIVADHAPSGGEQVARHRTAHDAEPNYADLSFHLLFSPC